METAVRMTALAILDTAPRLLDNDLSIIFAERMP